MLRPTARVTTSVGLGILVLALPAIRARRAAAARGEQAISAGLRYGQLSLPRDEEQLELDGAVLVLEWERGLSDTYGVRAHLAAGAYDGPEGKPLGGAGAVGLVYRFDVVRAVPYLQISAGAIAARGGGIDATLKPTMELGAGLDFLESRSFGWGFALAWDAFASDARFLTMGVRASWRWGWW